MGEIRDVGFCLLHLKSSRDRLRCSFQRRHSCCVCVCTCVLLVVCTCCSMMPSIFGVNFLLSHQSRGLIDFLLRSACYGRSCSSVKGLQNIDQLGSRSGNYVCFRVLLWFILFLLLYLSRLLLVACAAHEFDVISQSSL